MAEFTRGGARLPHDLRHLVVELELGVTDGIWGTIADGGMYTSMRFAGGHRLPYDAARKSDALKRPAITASAGPSSSPTLPSPSLP